jgi:D-alanyl-D-alanine carboxypeptidase
VSPAHASRAQIRRRRSGVALAAVLLVALLLVLLLPQGEPTPAAEGPSSGGPPSSSTDGGGSGATSTPNPNDAPVPAWLAWIPGGFPPGFANQVAHVDELGSIAIVAGDTRWMQASRDADGAIVDRPDPPYAIPLDAFSVDPGDYAPFLPEAERAEIVEALRHGQAVLGSTSAELRRLGPGGSVTIGGHTIEVGAVAPDDVVGWSELLVSRAVGERLGIEHDRYLLALGTDGLTLRAFTHDVRALFPREKDTVRPGGTRFVRVASGVNPPVVIKSVFGEFAAYPRSDDPAYLNVDPAWYDAHIVTETVPILGQVTCNRKFLPMLRGALQELVDRGLDHLIHIYSGCYAARTVARSTTAPPSNHAYGAAIDIDAPTNGYGDPTPAIDPRVVAVFRRWGFKWGGDFLITDGAHFEYLRPPRASAGA